MRDAVLVQLQQLRHHMAHMIANLQIYIQVSIEYCLPSVPFAFFFGVVGWWFPTHTKSVSH